MYYKTKTINVRMNENDYNEIKEKSKMAKMNMSEYLRRAGLEREIHKHNNVDLSNLDLSNISFEELLSPIN